MTSENNDHRTTEQKRAAMAEIAAEMVGMLAHDRALQDGCKACAMKVRLAELGVA